MNFETRSLHAETADAGEPVWIDHRQDEARRRRLMMIGAILLLLAVVAGAWWGFSGGSGDADATKAAAAGEGAQANGAANKGAAPTVTVMTPGRSTVERVISSTGTLAARREMPVATARH